MTALDGFGAVQALGILLLVGTVICLGDCGAAWLRAASISVYGQSEQVPRMRWANGCFVGWFVPSAAWVVGDASNGVWLLCAWLFYLSCLGLLALIDARTGLLPNELTMLFLISGLCWRTADADWGLPGSTYLWGAVVGWLAPTLLNACHERWRGSMAIGPGDAKLLAGIGAWLGTAALPSVWILASLALVVYTACQALFAKCWQPHVAFGPFLALGGSATLLGDML